MNHRFVSVLRRLVLTAVAVFFATSTLSAAIGDVRIYINPGHGAWCGECRHMGTVTHGGPTYTDTAGFYESNTNLQKGVGMFNKLVEYGLTYDKSKGARDLTNNVVMSRVASGDVHNGLYDRPLSEIAAEAELNNFDMFISIHSNAATEGTTTNYPLFLYRGYDTSEGNAGSKAMATACWPHWIKNPHMMWTNYTTSMNIRGDVSFWNESYTTTHSNGKSYSGYYGVLRQGVPGFLVEGYFHTYQPARHKAMNWDACKWEGEAYAKGVNDYFALGKKDSYGTIYGVLRDAETTFTHTYYTPNTSTLDRFLPINNATVTLKNSSGTVVATYTTDDEYNGVFVFNKVTPGTYTLVYSHPDYKDLTESVTVTANETVFPTPQISTSTEQIPVRGHYAYDLTSSQSGDIYTLKFKSTGAVDNASVILANTSTGSTQSIAIGAVVAGENSVTVDAKSLGEDATFSWSVAIDNPKSTGVELFHSDNSIIYNNGTKDARIGVAVDKDVTSANFGTIYTLTAMGQGLQKFNPDYTRNGSKVITGKFGADTDASTSSNKYVRSNRINVNGGKVYIANYANQNSGVWVYNPSGTTAAQVLSGYYERAVAFSGSGSSRVMYVVHESNFRYYNIGAADSWSGDPTGTYTTNMINGDGDILVTDKGMFVSQNRFSGNNTSEVPVFQFLNKSGSVLYNSSTLSSALTGSQSGGMAITNDLSTFAIVDGYASVSDIHVDIFNVIWSGETPSFTYQYSIPLTGTNQVDQMVFDHADNLIVASSQKGLLAYTIKKSSRQTVTKATSTIQGVREPGVRGHYAYDLSMTTETDTHTLSFKSTGAAESASILLTSTTDNSTLTFDIAGVTEGENTVTINRRELALGHKYNWAVIINNPKSPSVELLHSDNSIVYNNGSADARIGLAIDKDETSENFGTIYTLTSMGQGLQKFNPDYTKNGTKLITGMFGADTEASTSTNKFKRTNRLAINDGKIYIANYANLNSGIWEFDLATGDAPKNLSGTAYYERAVDFYGEGANRKAYSLHENNLQRFDIGTVAAWTSGAPSANYAGVGILDNGDGDIIVTDNGIIVSQWRYSGGNASSNPAFIVLDHSMNLVYKSDVLSGTLNGSQCGGIALSNDGKTFVIVDSYTEGSVASINAQVYDLKWSGTTPTFTHKYSIPLSGTNQVDQMEFDHADNLYIASQQKGLLVYALRTDARETRTNAASDQLLEYAELVGISDIDCNNTSAPVYFNMQGVRVTSDNLSSGIYIKVQNGKCHKIVVTK